MNKPRTFRQKIGPAVSAMAARLGIFIGGRKELARVKWGTAQPRSAKFYESLGVPVETIFDIGANVGEITAEYREHFPNASIYAFEPGKAAHAALAQRFEGDPKTFVRREAVSSADGEVCFEDLGSETSHITTLGTGAKIPARSVDSLCAELGIDRLSILKVDAEGHDLEVLRGAETMLRNGRIDTLIVEFGISPDKVPLDLFTDYLSGYGVGILLTFEDHYWENRLPEYCNALFIRRDILRKFPHSESDRDAASTPA